MIWWRVSPQCIILAIEVLVTLWRGWVSIWAMSRDCLLLCTVSIQATIAYCCGLLFATYSHCGRWLWGHLLQYYCGWYCAHYGGSVGFNRGNYCLIFLIIAHYFGGWLWVSIGAMLRDEASMTRGLPIWLSTLSISPMRRILILIFAISIISFCHLIPQQAHHKSGSVFALIGGVPSHIPWAREETSTNCHHQHYHHDLHRYNIVMLLLSSS